jgi:thiamine kinase-like enzyme
VNAETIAARVWPGADLRIEPLGGGITNHNFLVETGGEKFVLRIGGKDTELLGIDRGAEHGASLVAAYLGIGPEVVAFLEPEGYLVTRYIEGEVGKVDAVRAGATLRRAHDGPAIPGRFDSFRVVEAYWTIAVTRGVAVPPAYDRAKEVADRIERQLGARPLRPCHNDLLSANFIDDGRRLWIVDWEYAGMGDPAFDLANFAVNQELDEDGEAALLQAYTRGDVQVLIHHQALVLMRFMSDFREAMWGVVQQAISELDFDFRTYASDHFERLARTAVEPRFVRALTAAPERG